MNRISAHCNAIRTWSEGMYSDALRLKVGIAGEIIIWRKYRPKNWSQLYAMFCTAPSVVRTNASGCVFEQSGERDPERKMQWRISCISTNNLCHDTSKYRDAMQVKQSMIYHRGALFVPAAAWFRSAPFLSSEVGSTCVCKSET